MEMSNSGHYILLSLLAPAITDLTIRISEHFYLLSGSDCWRGEGKYSLVMPKVDLICKLPYTAGLMLDSFKQSRQTEI